MSPDRVDTLTATVDQLQKEQDHNTRILNLLITVSATIALAILLHSILLGRLAQELRR